MSYKQRGIQMGVISWIKAIFSKAIQAFRELLALALPEVKQIILGALKDIAINAVTQLDGLDLNNDQKRKTAFEQIKNYALAHGMDAKDSLINLAIELALQTLRKE
jgi:hypothetical protein